MTEKVKLSKEQAEAIESIVQNEFDGDKDEVLNYHAYIKGIWNLKQALPLRMLDVSDLAKALYIGYEVEPEFKVGDWVYDMQCDKVARIDHRGVDDNCVWVDDEDFNFFAIVNTRHATPEEIAEEKERRFFAEHGRNVWELKRGDIVRLSNGWIIEIDSIDLSQDFAIRFTNQNYVEDGAQLKNVQKLIVPVEKRLDWEVGNNE